MTLIQFFFLLACDRELWPQSRPAAVSDGAVGHHGRPSAHVQRPEGHLSTLKGAVAEQTHHSHQPGPARPAGIPHRQSECEV